MILLESLAHLRKLTLRYLALPRPSFPRVKWFSTTSNEAGYFHAARYIAHPWYVQPTFWSRWGPSALIARLLGGVLPGDEGTKYMPQGYRLAELGPDRMKMKGREFMEKDRIRLRQDVLLTCPIAARSHTLPP